MDEPGMYAWRNPWLRWSVVSLIGLTLVSVLVGFIWLPSSQADFSAQGLWASICRAAGVPSSWGGAPEPTTGVSQSTDVVLLRSMARAGTPTSIGRGATLALNCTMCHGAQGLSSSNAPNLAGQYPEVLLKQLHDYQSGKRPGAVMQAVSRNLAAQDIVDLSAYYAYLPPARSAPTRYDEPLPALVRVGDPMRNIAPCMSCHGGSDQKLGAPWLEGLPKAYVVAQLQAFKSGERHNDAQAQMRNMARSLTSREIDEVATFYARKSTATAAK